MKHLIIPFCLLSAVASFGQEEEWGATPPPSEKPLPPKPVQSEKIHTTLDESAKFPGGQTGLEDFINQHISYPPVVFEKGDVGTSQLRLIIDANGNARFDRWINTNDSCRECDKEALRLVKLMPKWTPAKLDGKAVSSFYDLTISFNMNGGSKASAREPEPVLEAKTAFVYVDEPAEYPEGPAALRRYIAENLRYPEGAKAKGIQGKCYLQLSIDETGKITNIKVVRNVPDCPECDQEAVRLAENMPDWKPGKIGGKPVVSTYNLPIRFELSNQ